MREGETCLAYWIGSKSQIFDRRPEQYSIIGLFCLVLPSVSGWADVLDTGTWELEVVVVTTIIISIVLFTEL